MILYLTYNDQPGGIYRSQVTDVTAHMDHLGTGRVRLVALVSARGFLSTRNAIRRHAPDAWVLPMVPTMQRWRANTATLAWVCRFLRPQGIMARGPFATWMALRMRDRGLVRKVCFDARGAYAAEWEEYRIVDDEALIAQVPTVESEAVRNSDMRLAVSRALLGFWQERYGHAGPAHTVIPCTLGEEALERSPHGNRTRADLGFAGTDVVLAYAGSVAGWQSFGLLERLLAPVLEQQPAVKLLFLSRPDPGIDRLQSRFPGRLKRVWVAPEEVHAVLAQCDHGLLLREDSITNRVASPTKFAEYLIAGLPVIITEHIGDYSAFVAEQRAGTVFRADAPAPAFPRTDAATRERMQALARTHFSKSTYDAGYRRILALLSGR